MQQAILTLWGVPDGVGRDNAGPFATFGSLKVALPGEAVPVLGPMKVDARLEEGVWAARSFLVVGAPTVASQDSTAAPSAPSRTGDDGVVRDAGSDHGRQRPREAIAGFTGVKGQTEAVASAPAGQRGHGHEGAGSVSGGSAFSGLARRQRPTAARSSNANADANGGTSSKPAATGAGRPRFDPNDDGHDVTF